MSKDNEPEVADGMVIRLQLNDAFCITTEEYEELHRNLFVNGLVDEVSLADKIILSLLASGLYRYNDIKRMRAEKAAGKPGAACPHDGGFLESLPPICAKCGQTVPSAARPSRSRIMSEPQEVTVEQAVTFAKTLLEKSITEAVGTLILAFNMDTVSAKATLLLAAIEKAREGGSVISEKYQELEQDALIVLAEDWADQ